LLLIFHSTYESIFFGQESLRIFLFSLYSNKGILKFVNEPNTEDFCLYKEHGMTSPNFIFYVLVKMLRLVLPFIRTKSNFCFETLLL